MKICRMNLIEDGDGFLGEHPFGSTVRFYPINSHDKEKDIKSKKWVWSYNDCHSSSFDNIEECVIDWRDTMSLPI